MNLGRIGDTKSLVKDEMNQTSRYIIFDQLYLFERLNIVAIGMNGDFIAQSRINNVLSRYENPVYVPKSDECAPQVRWVCMCYPFLFCFLSAVAENQGVKMGIISKY